MWKKKERFSTLNSAVLGSQLHTHYCQGRRSPGATVSGGDGLQVCLPLPKEVSDRKFSILLPSHKLYLCLWESGVYNPLWLNKKMVCS